MNTTARQPGHREAGAATVPDGAPTVLVALLRVVGGSPSDAAHISAALAAHRRSQADEGAAVPASIRAVEQLAASVFFGSRRATEGQRSAEFDHSPRVPDGERVTTNDSLLTRAQAARRARCSTSTIKRREAAGDLVAVRHGRVVPYRAGDIDNLGDR